MRELVPTKPASPRPDPAKPTILFTGESIVDYQSLQRVRHASLLLQTPGVTVVTAAAAVGLDSPSYLARLFRKYGQALPRSFKV